MWTIIKNQIKSFLLNLLRDHLYKPESMDRPVLLADPVDGKEPGREIKTLWRVTGTAEVTYEITGLPHEGGVGRCFLEVDRTLTLPEGVAYDDRDEYLIDQAFKIEQQKLGNQGMIFGKWYDKPTVAFVKKYHVE